MLSKNETTIACPNCNSTMTILRSEMQMCCPHCDEVFAVDWSGDYNCRIHQQAEPCASCDEQIANRQPVAPNESAVCSRGATIGANYTIKDARSDNINEAFEAWWESQGLDGERVRARDIDRWTLARSAFIAGRASENRVSPEVTFSEAMRGVEL
jgi:phage terminase large subunit GpA-like protein